MDVTKKKVLNGYHVVFLVQNIMVGMGLLSLNNSLSPVGYGQWWLPVLFGLVANATLIPIIWLALQYKDDDLFDIHEKLFGKWIGKTLNSLLILYATVLFAAVIQNYLDLIQSTALPGRLMTGHLILFILLTVFIIKGGIKSLARFCILTFFLTGWMIYFLRWGIAEGEIRHLLPLFNFTASEFWDATKKGYNTLVGYELIMFYFPYIRKPEKAFKHASIGIWLTTSFYLAVTIVGVMYFSEWQLEHVLFPVLKLFQAVDLAFVERIDTFGITIWVFLILTTAGAYLWTAKKGMDSVRNKNSQYHIYVMAVMTYIIINLPISQLMRKALYEKIFYVSYGLILWPILLCLLHLVRRKKKEAKK
ncbi:GerAB/ArcD/ProY family transporter [Paenisporosarcina sp. FSL H8-0542]|uniref:GerAB/ArcD/ProY family transporter n=1 Tax=unclassified Paenisporosarcina TaxID=2642018 RepID=UPI00034E2BD8|nr:GerAB/ArcD/ProY family transporter [Paenisporosarcina sp. HGH0030]EPD51388.1 spore germination protein (amino acid permease) [Paenisporosarcina sp. HGH0030]